MPKAHNACGTTSGMVSALESWAPNSHESWTTAQPRHTKKNASSARKASASACMKARSRSGIFVTSTSTRMWARVVRASHRPQAMPKASMYPVSSTVARELTLKNLRASTSKETKSEHTTNNQPAAAFMNRPSRSLAWRSRSSPASSRFLISRRPPCGCLRRLGRPRRFQRRREPRAARRPAPARADRWCGAPRSRRA